MSITRPRIAAEAYDLGAVTAAEKLWIWRHRQRVGDERSRLSKLRRPGWPINKDEAAALLGVSLGAYDALENGEWTEDAARDARWLTDIANAKVGPSGGIVFTATIALKNAKVAQLRPSEVARVVEAVAGVKPTVAELCLLARRRSGEKRSAILADEKVSVPKWQEMEQAGDERVVARWQARGFRFP